MIKILYHAYVRIRGFQNELPIKEAINLSAIAPLTAKLTRLLLPADNPTWLNDVYLNFSIQAVFIPSRFTASEDIMCHINSTAPP
jgi:hypothetical protein